MRPEPIVMFRSLRYQLYAHAGQYLVGGWLRRTGLALIAAVDDLQRDRGIRGHVAEIGVHHGRLLIALSLMRRPDENAVGVDIFEDQHLNPDASGRGDRARLEANLRRWDPRSADVRIAKADSRSLAGCNLIELAGGRLRLVSVDGGHTADLTTHDLGTACAALAEGGVVILDDAFNGLFPAVGEAMQDFLSADGRYRTIAVGGNKTLICRREDAASYLDLLPLHLARGYGVKQQKFLDHPLHVVQRTRRRIVKMSSG